MGFINFSVQKWAVFGAVIGAIHYGLGWVINRFAGVNVEFATISLAEARGQFSNIGQMLVEFSPFNPELGLTMGLLVSIVAGIVVVLVGRLLLGIIPVRGLTSSAMRKVASVLVLGMLALTIVLVNAGLPGFQTALALVIWGLVLAWITVQLAGMNWFPVKVPQN